MSMNTEPNKTSENSDDEIAINFHGSKQNWENKNIKERWKQKENPRLRLSCLTAR